MQAGTLKLKAVVAFAILAVIGAVGYFASRSFGPSSKTTATAEREPERYFDWNWADTPAEQKLRPYLAARLAEPGSVEGSVTYRLIRRVSINEGEARIELRSAAYWSDETLFEAAQVVAALGRLREGVNAGHVKNLPEQEMVWLRGLEVKASGRHELTIKGFRDAKDLDQALASFVLAPIRSDLLGDDGKTDSGWLVTLGPYHLTEIPSGDAENFILKPNPFYYRGAPEADKTIALKELVGH